MSTTNQGDKSLSGDALANKITKNKRKRILSKIGINLFHLTFLTLVGGLLVFGHWLFAGAILIAWLAVLLSF